MAVWVTAAGSATWMYNPYFGMFTYMPYTGMFYSPFGYSFFSPGMVGYLYMPGSPYYMAGGTSGLGNNLVSAEWIESQSDGPARLPAAPVTRSGFAAGSSSSSSGFSTVGGSPGRASSGVFGGGGSGLSGGGGHSAGGHK